MDYWKNHQQTLATDYQDLSFTKHTPLKTSHIHSFSILNDTNLNLHLRNSSIQSIRSPLKSRYVPAKDHLQNQLIGSHASRSQMCLRDISLNDNIKRCAYLFFNQQKNKIQTTNKSNQYLLPKICVKSKKTYQSINSRNQQNQKNSEIKNSKEQSKQKLQKKSIYNKCKLNINDLRKSLDEEDNVTSIAQKFRLKCEAELGKIGFKIPDNFGRQRCFFDLTHEEISQLYANPQSQKKEKNGQQTDTKLQKRSSRKDKKFSLVRIESEGCELKQNKSIPGFLMARLSAKDVYRSSNNSFLTDVPRMSKKMPQKPRLRHIV